MKHVLIQDTGEMLVSGFNEEERNMIEKDPEYIKKWISKVITKNKYDRFFAKENPRLIVLKVKDVPPPPSPYKTDSNTYINRS